MLTVHIFHADGSLPTVKRAAGTPVFWNSNCRYPAPVVIVAGTTLSGAALGATKWVPLTGTAHDSWNHNGD